MCLFLFQFVFVLIFSVTAVPISTVDILGVTPTLRYGRNDCTYDQWYWNNEHMFFLVDLIVDLLLYSGMRKLALHVT